MRIVIRSFGCCAHWTQACEFCATGILTAYWRFDDHDLTCVPQQSSIVRSILPPYKRQRVRVVSLKRRRQWRETRSDADRIREVHPARRREASDGAGTVRGAAKVGAAEASSATDVPVLGTAAAPGIGTADPGHAGAARTRGPGPGRTTDVPRVTTASAREVMSANWTRKRPSRRHPP